MDWKQRKTEMLHYGHIHTGAEAYFTSTTMVYKPEFSNFMQHTESKSMAH